MRSILVALALTTSVCFGQIKAVIFDYGGVVGDIDRESVLNFISKSLNVDQKEALALAHGWKKTFEVEDEFYWQKTKNVSEQWCEEFNEVVLAAMHQNDAIVSLVKELQKKGYVTALFSNVTKGAAKWLEKKNYYQHFNPLFLSYEMGLVKPDPKAYEYVLAELNLKPQEVVFVDDKKENVEAALGLGWQAIHFNSEATFLKELSNILESE